MERGSDNPTQVLVELIYSQDHDSLLANGYRAQQIELIQSLRDNDSEINQSLVNSYQEQGMSPEDATRKACTMLYHVDARRLKIIKDENINSVEDYIKGAPAETQTTQPPTEAGDSTPTKNRGKKRFRLVNLVGKRSVDEKMANETKPAIQQLALPTPARKPQPSEDVPVPAAPVLPVLEQSPAPRLRVPRSAKANQTRTIPEPRTLETSTVSEGQVPDPVNETEQSIEPAASKEEAQPVYKEQKAAPSTVLINFKDGQQFLQQGRAVYWVDPGSGELVRRATLDKDEELELSIGQPLELSGTVAFSNEPGMLKSDSPIASIESLEDVEEQDPNELVNSENTPDLLDDLGFKPDDDPNLLEENKDKQKANLKVSLRKGMGRAARLLKRGPDASVKFYETVRSSRRNKVLALGAVALAIVAIVTPLAETNGNSQPQIARSTEQNNGHSGAQSSNNVSPTPSTSFNPSAFPTTYGKNSEGGNTASISIPPEVLKQLTAK